MSISPDERAYYLRLEKRLATLHQRLVEEFKASEGLASQEVSDALEVACVMTGGAVLAAVQAARLTAPLTGP